MPSSGLRRRKLRLQATRISLPVKVDRARTSSATRVWFSPFARIVISSPRVLLRQDLLDQWKASILVDGKMNRPRTCLKRDVILRAPDRERMRRQFRTDKDRAADDERSSFQGN